MREELFIHRSWTTAGTTGATTGTTGYLRSNGKKSLWFARNKPTGTTGLLSVLPTIAGTTGGRPVPPAVQISATKVSADLACRYYRRFTPVLLVLAGTTGPSPVLPVVHFLAKLRRRAGTAGTTGPEGWYYRVTLAEKKFPRCSCMQVLVSLFWFSFNTWALYLPQTN